MGTAWKGVPGEPRWAQAPAPALPTAAPTPSLGDGGPAHRGGFCSDRVLILTVVSEGGLPLSTDAFVRLF